MTLVTLATLETTNFVFTALGLTEKGARIALRRGWDAHREQFPSAEPWDDDLEEEVVISVLPVGACLRDGERLGGARRCQVSPGGAK